MEKIDKKIFILLICLISGILITLGIIINNAKLVEIASLLYVLGIYILFLI